MLAKTCYDLQLGLKIAFFLGQIKLLQSLDSLMLTLQADSTI